MKSASKDTACSELADYEWLTGEEAARLAAEATADRAPLHRRLEQLRRHLSPIRAGLIVEQVELRRRARMKFARANEMFFTRLGLEQASDEWVAAYKASRFPRGREVIDLCCGIGGDLLALARRGHVVGVDRSPAAGCLAAANVRGVLSLRDLETVRVRTADVEEFKLCDSTAWHIDPDRRPGGRRTTDLARFSPGIEVIERLLAISHDAAIKLAPASRAPDAWAERCELEWISRGGECRQLVAWHGGLAEAAGKRSATIVRECDEGFETRKLTGAANHSAPIAAAPDKYVFDVDPAVLAAQLKGAIAKEHGLSALSPGPTYLTGPTAVDDAALDCFEVVDVLPLRTPTLGRFLHARRIGRLEIKVRGIELDPERLRRSLKPRGEEAAVLLITAVAGRAAAILGRRPVCG